jgi:hypothetical protein
MEIQEAEIKPCTEAVEPRVKQSAIEVFPVTILPSESKETDLPIKTASVTERAEETITGEDTERLTPPI